MPKDVGYPTETNMNSQPSLPAMKGKMKKGAPMTKNTKVLKGVNCKTYGNREGK